MALTPSEQSQQAQNQWDKIRKMVHTFQSMHADWHIYTNRHQVVLETNSFDFHPISELLEQHGFLHSEYELHVEYERKWGML